MKILVVRFSSIGDIVLTTSVLRALKNQITGVEIHYLTKIQFSTLLEDNPNVSKLITIGKSIDEVIEELKAENYDHIIDLHNNIRTASLKRKLGRPSYTFRKLNWKKGLYVKLKINQMPDLHVVDRYFEAVEPLGVYNDQNPGEFFINLKEAVDVKESYGLTPHKFICIAIGAQYKTKQMTIALLVSILKEVEMPVALIGSEVDADFGNQITSLLPAHVIVNTCGNHSLQGSASIVGQCYKLLTNDTGMMHIAACLNIKIVSVWGNTVPAFGMYPYYPGREPMYSIHEVKDLKCRPCSKIGYQKCPKRHFNCMKLQDANAIAKELVN